jgi:hypothetical protein
MSLPCHNSTQNLGAWCRLGGEVAHARRRAQAERAQGGAAEGSGAPLDVSGLAFECSTSFA